MATNYAHASYTEVIDLQTTPGKCTVIGVHTPVGSSPYWKLRGFFTQFRKFRYKGISSIKTAPASQLPIDPLGLTLQTNSVDAMSPRDTWNPILFKGCHGTSMDQLLDVVFGAGEYVNVNAQNSAPSKVGPSGTTLAETVGATPSTRITELSNLLDTKYYQYLTDVTWKKFGVQQPITIRNLYPLVWKMARNMPLVPSLGNDYFNNNAGMLEGIVTGSSSGMGTTFQDPSVTSDSMRNDYPTGPVGQVPTVGPLPERAYVQEFTNGTSRLGWLPTTTPTQQATTVGEVRRITGLPKLFMSVFVLPPCYNVQQFQRMVIRHEFEFKDFTSSLSLMDPAISEPSTLGTGNVYTNFIEYIDSNSKEKESGVANVGATLDIVNGDSDLMSDGVN